MRQLAFRKPCPTPQLTFAARSAGSHLETRVLGVLKKLQQVEGGGVAPSAPGGQPGTGIPRARGARGPRSGAETPLFTTFYVACLLLGMSYFCGHRLMKGHRRRPRPRHPRPLLCCESRWHTCGSALFPPMLDRSCVR